MPISKSLRILNILTMKNKNIALVPKTCLFPYIDVLAHI